MTPPQESTSQFQPNLVGNMLRGWEFNCSNKGAGSFRGPNKEQTKKSPFGHVWPRHQGLQHFYRDIKGNTQKSSQERIQQIGQFST